MTNVCLFVYYKRSHMRTTIIINLVSNVSEKYLTIVLATCSEIYFFNSCNRFMSRIAVLFQVKILGNKYQRTNITIGSVISSLLVLHENISYQINFCQSLDHVLLC